MYQLAYQNPTLVPGTEFPSARRTRRTSTSSSPTWLDATCAIVNDPDKDERLFWNNHT
jgi:predicted TIM-barrel fold metal-dependent hydrolase